MRNVFTVAVVAAALFMAAGAWGSRHYVPHKPFGKMTPAERESWFARQIAHDKGSIRWLNHHLATPFPERYVLSITRVVLPIQGTVQDRTWKHALTWYRTSLRITTTHLAALRTQIQASEVPLILREHGLGLPPAWYMHDIGCIETGESGNGAGSSNLFGMLAGWYAAGGTDSPSAWDASYTEQLDRTWILYNMDGWSPWATAPGCGL